MPNRLRSMACVMGAMLAVPLLVAAGATASPAARQAAPAQVAVIPPDPNPVTTPPTDTLLFAGTDGFLHRFSFDMYHTSPYLWTSYATGATTVVSAMSGVLEGGFYGAGGDSIAIWPLSMSAPLTELNLATGQSRQYQVPAGYTPYGLYGNAMIAGQQAGGVWTDSVLTFAPDGTYTVTAVTGLPAGGAIAALPKIGDDSDALVRYAADGTLAYGLLDLSSGDFTPIPDSSVSGRYAPVLTAASVAVPQSGTTVDVFSRAGLLSGTDTAPQAVTLPGTTPYQVALAGNYVVGVPASGTGPAVAVPVSGGSAAQVIAQDEGAIASPLWQAPDGALVVGGSGVADWAVREVSTAPDGGLDNAAVLPLTGISNAGLTISQGKVWHAEATPGFGVNDFVLFGHALLPDNNWNVTETPSLYDLINDAPLPCAPDASCVRVVDGNSYGPAYLGALGGSPPRMTLFEGVSYTGGVSYPAPGALIDASPDYAIVDVAASRTAPAEQLLVHVGYATGGNSGPITGAGLWFDTLWRANAAGQLQATDLTTMTAAKPVGTGSNCRASDVQATGRWVYWACGTKGTAGVYDQRTRKEIPVPGGLALLGDGYIVQQDRAAGSLVMYDVHTDSLAGPLTLGAGVAAGPAADNRNITWAVDEYSGDVAYVDAGDAVHVIDTGVPSTPVAIGEPTPAQLSNPITFSSWGQALFLTRPVSSWTVTIRRVSTRQIVHTESGGPARYGISPTWNFRLPGGALAYSGRYTWTLTATAAGATAASRVATYPLPLDCGTPPFRSVDCDGAPALLAVKANSDAYWYQETSGGKLANNGYTENWQLCAQPVSGCVTALVPFGDFAGKGYADLLVRTGNGVLRAYLGIGQADFNPQSTTSIVIGRGWNRYNALIDPGTMTTGGKLQLLARDHQGRLWRYTATGHGKFDRPVVISGGWGKYVRLIGAGDLTGDGIGDVLAIGRGGDMWVYYGNGRGGFGKPHLVSPGWNRYNVILGIGDLKNNGRDDIVARDQHGRLWFFASNGRGGFASPVLLGKGWNQYAGLF